MAIHKFKRNNDFNFMNNKSVLLDIQVEPEYDNVDTIPLDTRVKHEYDIERALKHEYDNEESSCHSGLRAGIQRDNNLMPKTFQFAQSGRSMVEMLGVLAVIGVLSIGGIMGYNYAIAKTKSNSIMNELTLRAMALSASLERTTPTVNTPLTMEMGTVFQMGYATTAKMSVNPEYFEITVQGVDKKICELTLTDYNLSAFTIVNNALYENSTAVCNDAENDMIFVYKKDLGERRTCAAKGFFNIDSYKCECAGGTYFDNTTKDCVCPAGHIWSDTERKCIESRCGDNEFESLDGGCVSCEDPNGYRIDQNDENAIALCEACEERVYNSSSNGRCLLKGCTMGENYLDSEGICQKCADRRSRYLSNTQYGMDTCKACPTMHVSYVVNTVPVCTSNTLCSEQKFVYTKSGFTSKCADCNSPDDFQIGWKKDGQGGIASEDIASCRACKDENGNQIRDIYTQDYIIYCRKIVCNSNEFKGTDGKCYSCTEAKQIAVNNNSGCDSTTCDRIIENGLCKMKTCPTDTHVLLSDGSCYDCETSQAFSSSEEECNKCTNRGWLGTSNNLCTKKCKKYEQFPHANALLCYGCSSSFVAGYSGTSAYAKEYCEACGGYVADDGWCFSENACEQGITFPDIVNYASLCVSCSYSDKVQLSGHEKLNQKCAACTTTPRFFADNYCYRCDSSESPVVIAPEEQASCKACPNRKIDATNKCVLVVAEG